MTERRGWTAATVGCHWFYGERLGVVSTFRQGTRSGYTAAVNIVSLGEFETLQEAQEAVERTVAYHVIIDALEAVGDVPDDIKDTVSNLIETVQLGAA